MPQKPVSPNEAEWDEAWKFVQRLAQSRRHIVREGEALPSSPKPPPPETAAEPKQIDRDIEDIERASALLRTRHPDLQPARVDEEAPAVSRPRPIWLIVGAMWLATMLVTVAATLALAALMK
jgi:hypothetical protein